MCGRCGGAAGLGASVLGYAFVRVRSGAAPVWSARCEVWSRDVFVSLRDFVIECYNMYDTICKDFHTQLSLTDALAPPWHKSRRPMGPQASTRPRTSICDSLETLNACCERTPSSAGSCGRQVCRRADEKSRLVEARASIHTGKVRFRWSMWLTRRGLVVQYNICGARWLSRYFGRGR